MESLKQPFRYDRWANERAAEALSMARGDLTREIGLLAHVLASQQIWFARLTSSNSRLEVFPSWDLVMCQALLEELEFSWNSYFNELDAQQLDVEMACRNRRGDDFINTRRDILSHVINHGTHHRAQLACFLRGRGHQPPLMDFIYFTREMQKT